MCLPPFSLLKVQDSFGEHYALTTLDEIEWASAYQRCYYLHLYSKIIVELKLDVNNSPFHGLLNWHKLFFFTNPRASLRVRPRLCRQNKGIRAKHRLRFFICLHSSLSTFPCLLAVSTHARAWLLSSVPSAFRKLWKMKSRQISLSIYVSNMRFYKMMAFIT